MRQLSFWHRAGIGAGAAAALFTAVWVSVAAAAPGVKHCRLARGWVQDNCGSAAGREGTPARCSKARAWVDANCPARMAMAIKPASEPAHRSEGDDEDDDEATEEVTTVPPRHRKRAHKARRQAVRTYVARSEPALHHRGRRYKDKVFVSDYRRLRGNEQAFYTALEKDRY
jgi:hypothetical protein